MPPVPVPYDRKDCAFRGERKIHDEGHLDALGGTGGGGSYLFSTPRWRDQYHSPSPRRLISGSNGFTPSRSEGEGFRSSFGSDVSGDNRNDTFKEGRGLFMRSSWNSRDPARHHHDSVTASNDQKSVADMLPSASASPSSSCQPTYLKDHHDKNSGVVNDVAEGTADDRDRDLLLGPISRKKWSRSGSFSSSTKPISRSQLNEIELESSGIPDSGTPMQVAVTSLSLPAEGNPKKKQRLGWGQGLAKYEKQKVEGLEDSSGKDSVAHGGSRFTCTLSDSSPKTGAVDCASPATPTSITCSSYRGVFDENVELNIANNDVTSLCESPLLEHQRSPEGFFTELDNPSGDSLFSLNSFISEFLQPEEFCSGDSNFTMQTALNKLLMLKSDILKEVEKTEGEIDCAENELKTINADCQGCADSQYSQSLADILSNKACDNFPYSTIKEIPSGSSPVSNNSQMNYPSDDFESKTKDLQCIGETVATMKSVAKGGSTSSCALTLDKYPGKHKASLIGQLGTQIALPIESDVIGTRPFACNADGLDVIPSAISSEKILDDEADCCTVAQIMTSNRESARKASEALGSWSLFTSPIFDGDFLSKPVDLNIKVRVSARKRILKFQERALVLKFRAFLLLWKEDLRLLAWWKRRQKSQKRCDFNYRSLQNGSQKNRSSLHFSSAGHSSLVPTSEIVNSTSRMLLHNEIKIHRCHLKMPALILDERERKQSVFVSKNGLIVDPFIFEKEKTFINLWNADEKMNFLEKLETYGKNFRKVASFLEHKTTADCVEFYYKNHRSESFSAVKKILKHRKQEQALPSNKYMVASGRKWNEANVGPLDILGEVSSIVAYSNDKTRQKYTGKAVLKCAHDSKIYRWTDARNSSAAYHAGDIAGDVLAGIDISISSEGMNSCITNSVNLGENVGLLHGEHHIFPEVSLANDDEDTCSDDGFTGPESVDWTDKEKTLFINALRLYGRDFSQISLVIGTRSKEQCKIFFSKARKCLSLDMVYRGASSSEVVLSSDVNEIRCDTDDAYLAEMEPATCVSQSCCKLDDFTQSEVEKTSQEFQQVTNSFHRTDNSEQSGVRVSKHEDGAKTINTAVLPSGSDAKMTRFIGAEQLMMDLDEKSCVSIRNNNPEKLCDDVENKIMESNKMLQIPSAVTSGSDFLCRSEMMEIVDQECCTSPLNISSNNCTSSQLDLTCHATLGTTQQDNNCHFSDAIYTTNQQIEDRMKHHHESQILSWKPKDNYAPPLGKLSFSDMPYQHLEDDTHVVKQSSLIKEPSMPHHQYSCCKDAYQHLLANQLLPRANPSLHILKGYPLHLLNAKGTMNVDTFDQKHVSLHDYSEKSTSLDVLPIAPGVHVEEYSKCKHVNLDCCSSLVPKSKGLPDPHLKPCSQDNGSETDEQSLRTGDFKLFGRILSHPPFTPKSGEIEDKSPPKPNNSGLKLDTLTGNKDFIPLQSETISNTSVEDLPLRTYGFWDGKRIQTGFTSLPESTIILSKCSGGLSDVAHHPTKDSVGSNGLTALQCSFQEDKKQQSIFHEKQKNSLDVLSGIQQRGQVAMSLVGGGSSLVGVSFSSVSDPVASIKMHYASHPGLLGKDMDSWRSDTGGR